MKKHTRLTQCLFAFIAIMGILLAGCDDATDSGGKGGGSAKNGAWHRFWQ